ncbi:MAG: pyridoxal-phosphate dependent enzyme, partial [Candidatus Promineifilaceae bacterium]
GTLVGLTVGFALLGSPVKVLGLDIGKLWKNFPATLAKLATRLSGVLGEGRDYRPKDIPLIEERYAGPGYGVKTAETEAAMSLLAGQEGIILDPVYTGKGFAGVLDLVGRGYFGSEEQVVFLHTGGGPGLFRD